MLDERLVRNVHLFSVLDDEQLATLLRYTRAVQLQENETLFEFGQSAERFYLLVSGQVKLFRVSEDGNEKIIEIVSPGKLFAEAVMFIQHGRYPVSATALQPSEVYSFENRAFARMLQESNGLCLKLLASLSMRLHAQINEIDNLSLQNATFRVIGYMLDLLPDPCTESAVLDLAVPKQVIASRLSITPETLSRILHTMARNDIISINGKIIAIKSVQRLREFGRYNRAQYAGVR